MPVEIARSVYIVITLDTFKGELHETDCMTDIEHALA